MDGAMSGALLENYAVAEIMKTCQNAGQEPFFIITGIRMPGRLTCFWNRTARGPLTRII